MIYAGQNYFIVNNTLPGKTANSLVVVAMGIHPHTELSI
jgi:hypothetical protein